MSSIGKTNALTRPEADAFQRDGYLLLPGALDAAQLQALKAAAERLEATVPPNETSSFYNYADILGLDDAFVDLIDHALVLPKIVGLLGFNIQVNHAHFNEDRPSPNEGGYLWHRDGAIALWDLPRPVPILGVKVGYYLTDLPDDRHGNTFVIRGSNQDQARPLPQQGTRPDDADPVCGPAGSALLMDPRAIHGRGPNHSTAVRKVVFVQYGFRWIKPLDAMRVEALATRCTDPIRRQLLALDQRENRARRTGAWYPAEADLPLWSAVTKALGPKAEEVVGVFSGLPRGWSTRPLPTRPSQY